jgi:hypothetical protein
MLKYECGFNFQMSIVIKEAATVRSVDDKIENLKLPTHSYLANCVKVVHWLVHGVSEFSDTGCNTM